MRLRGPVCSDGAFLFMDTTYLIDNYVSTKPGDAYRLFPFGRIVKNGKAREITPEYAARFRLPHFKPPMKLGSHNETTPAGGHIIALEVRSDGLYAIPELTDGGAKALSDGAYRYHSPEVIWDGGSLEDPTTGQAINGPLIVGDALLHTPHLGEATALYSIEPITLGGETMSEETVQVPKSMWDKFTAWFSKRVDEEQPALVAEPTVQTDNFAAIQAERDEFKAKLDKMEAEASHKTRVEAFGAKLSETLVKDGAEMLASMTDEQSAWVLKNFSALSAQVKANDRLTEEIGSTSSAPSGASAIQSAIEGVMSDRKIGYPEAFMAVTRERPELFKV